MVRKSFKELYKFSFTNPSSSLNTQLKYNAYKGRENILSIYNNFIKLLYIERDFTTPYGALKNN